MQGGPNGQKRINNGAAINMHLAASLFTLRQTDAAGESALHAGSPSRGNTSSPPSAGSPSDVNPSSEQGFKEDAADGTNATQMSQHQKSVACAVNGAARASVVATELSDAPMVDLVAGMLDAEATHLREAKMGDVVKTMLI